MPEERGFPKKKKRLTAPEAAARAPKEFARRFPRTRQELVQSIGEKTKQLRQLTTDTGREAVALQKAKRRRPKTRLVDVPARRKRKPSPGATAEAATPARKVVRSAAAEGAQETAQQAAQAVDERARKRGAPPIRATAEAARRRKQPAPAPKPERRRESPPGRLQELFEMGLISKRDLGREMRLEEKRILGR